MQLQEVQEAVPKGYTLELGNLRREEYWKHITNDGIQGVPGAESMVGCSPDGGIFFLVNVKEGTRELLLASEAKHQQNKGNACERAYKNHIQLSDCGLKAYMIFASGEGAKPMGILGRIFQLIFYNHAKHEKDAMGRSSTPDEAVTMHHFNVVYNEGPSIFLEPAGFSEEQVKAVMAPVLMRILRSTHSTKTQ